MFDTFFNVEKKPVFIQTESGFDQVPRVRAIVNSQTGHTLSIMSKEYEPVTDEQVLNKFLEIFQESQINIAPVKHHINVSKDGAVGRVTHMELDLPDFKLFPDSQEEQRCRVIIPNSFDGTTALSFNLMYWRLVCSNGMMGWKEEFTMKIRHRKGAENRLQDAIQLYLHDNVYRTQREIENLQNKEGLRDNVLVYLQKNPVLSGDRWSEKLLGQWLKSNTSCNFWDLYNIFTHEITHAYGRNFGSKLNKMELLNKEVLGWDSLLTNNASSVLVN